MGLFSRRRRYRTGGPVLSERGQGVAVLLTLLGIILWGIAEAMSGGGVG